MLGAWKDSRDCYYFNDYIKGDNGTKQTWIVSKTDQSNLRFGDKVFIENKYFHGERLCPDSWYKNYLTTKKGDDTYWTIEPISAEIPGLNSITLDKEYYLRHVKTKRWL